LKLIAEKTQDLYKKAVEFDNKMIDLNRQYNFLSNSIKYEEKRFTQLMVPSVPQGLGKGS